MARSAGHRGIGLCSGHSDRIQSRFQYAGQRGVSLFSRHKTTSDLDSAVGRTPQSQFQYAEQRGIRLCSMAGQHRVSFSTQNSVESDSEVGRTTRSQIMQ